MEIRLYHNFIKRNDSTKQPSAVVYEIRDVRLKEETSITNPTFLLSNYNSQYNYIYVPKWNRYYFVSNVILNITGIFEVSCTCDRLATFKTEIGNTNTFIERTSDTRHISQYMRDNAVSCENRIVSTESATTDAFPSSSVYVLRVMGRGTTNGIGTFIVNYNDIKSIFSGIWGNIDDGSITDYIQALANLYINDPSQYIVGVYRSPIPITKYLENGTDEVTVYVGGHETNLKAIRVDSPNTIIFNPHLNKPINFYTDFRATDPAFTEYTLYIPTIGNISLPAEIMDRDLQIICCADLFSGDLNFMLYADGDLISTYNSNCYASVSVGIQNGSGGGALLSNALGVVGGVSTGNIALATSNVIQGTRSILSPPASVLGNQGSIGSVQQYPDFIITCMQRSSGDAPINVYGKPCEKNMLIKNLTGFVKCQKASIELNGTTDDRETINNYLNNGFYYE